MLDNLVRFWFDRVADEDVFNGLGWYGRAHEDVVRLGYLYDVAAPLAAGVVAVLSPRLPWAKNIRAAAHVIQCWYEGRAADAFGKTGAFNGNVSKALAILTSKSLAPLRGPKVESFHRNLVYPWDQSTVTIDTWAWRVWADDWTSIAKTGIPYQKIASDYLAAAEEVGYLALDFQAITWEAARRVAGGKVRPVK